MITFLMIMTIALSFSNLWLWISHKKHLEWHFNRAPRARVFKKGKGNRPMSEKIKRFIIETLCILQWRLLIAEKLISLAFDIMPDESETKVVFAQYYSQYIIEIRELPENKPKRRHSRERGNPDESKT